MKKWVVALLVGLALLSFGAGVGVNDDTIKCGSEIMSPGDTCEETRNGQVTATRTYEEMKESHEAGQRTFNSWGRWVLLGGGLVLTVLGIAGIVKTRRKRAAAGPSTADLHLGQQQAHPQQAHAQQAYPQQAYPQHAQTPQGAYPAQGQQYPPQGQPYAPQGQSHTPPQGQPYPQQGQPQTPPQGQYGPPPGQFGPQGTQYPPQDQPQNQQYPPQNFGPGSH